MQKHLEKMDTKQDGFKPFFPATYNPSCRADFCVHRNTASCVLSISKVFSDAEQLALAGGWKTPSEVRVLYSLKMDLL